MDGAPLRRPSFVALLTVEMLILLGSSRFVHDCDVDEGRGTDVVGSRHGCVASVSYSGADAVTSRLHGMAGSAEGLRGFFLRTIIAVIIPPQIRRSISS